MRIGTIDQEYAWARRAAVLLTLAISILFISSINKWSIDFPNSDDYSAIVQPTLDARAAPTLEAALVPIFEPHTQHYQVLLRAVSWLSAFLSGTLNFRLLIFLGSLFIFPLLWALSPPGTRNRAFAALTAALLLCQPQYAEATQWATNAIPYLWVNSFALLAFTFARSAGIGAFTLSMLSAALALLSWGNGILVAIELAAVLLFLRPLRAILFLLLAGAGAALHVSNANTAGISMATPAHLTEAGLYGLRVLGSAVGFLSAELSLLAALSSLGLWLLLLFAAFRSARWAVFTKPLFLFEVFLLASCLLCGAARFLEGAETAYATGRYTLPSILFLTCLCMRLVRSLDATRPSRLLAIGAVISSAFVWWSYAQYTYYDNYLVRAELLSDTRARWACFGDGLAGLGWQDLPPLHRTAERAGVLAMLPGTECTERLVSSRVYTEPGGNAEPTIRQLDYVLRSDRYLHVSGYAFRTEDSRWEGEYALVLKNEQQRFIAELEARTRPDVQYHLAVQSRLQKLPASDYRRSGFSGFIDLSSLPPGRYETFLQLRSNRRLSWNKLDVPVTVEGRLLPTEEAD